MAVFKLTDKDKEEIVDAAKVLTRRKKDFELTRCPLTRDDFETIANTPEGLKVAHNAREHNYVINVKSVFNLQINRFSLGLEECHIPMFVGLEVRFAHPILANIIDTKTAKDHSKYHKCACSFDMTMLPEAQRHAVAAWVNKLHRAIREYYLCTNAIAEYVKQLNTTAELLATWPMLSKLPRRTNDVGSRLTARFAQPPRRLGSYRKSWPTGEKYLDAERIILGVNEAMAKAWMLPDEPKFPPSSGINQIDIRTFQSRQNAPWYLQSIP